MNEKSINSWDEFPKTISDIEIEIAGFRQSHAIPVFVPSRIIYRGQSDSAWPLNSTLERYSIREWTVGSVSFEKRRKRNKSWLSLFMEYKLILDFEQLRRYCFLLVSVLLLRYRYNLYRIETIHACN